MTKVQPTRAVLKSMYEELSQIQQAWDLSSSQIADLLHVSSESFSDWMISKSKDSAAEDLSMMAMLGSMETLISIYRRLCSRLPRARDQVRWLFSENKDFGGSRPIDVAMSSLDNLVWLNYYLGSPGPGLAQPSRSSGSETSPG